MQTRSKKTLEVVHTDLSRKCDIDWNYARGEHCKKKSTEKSLRAHNSASVFVFCVFGVELALVLEVMGRVVILSVLFRPHSILIPLVSAHGLLL